MSPVYGFMSPFLARKGDRGMVERCVEHRPRSSAAEGLRQSPAAPATTEKMDDTLFRAPGQQLSELSKTFKKALFKALAEI